MFARDDFIPRYHAFNASLSSDAIQAQGPHEIIHNQSAQLFRNGLAVVGFNSLEDFIKKRTSEALTSLSSFNIPFSHLPEKIRNACTTGTISSLKFQTDLRKSHQEKLSFIHDAASKIASTSVDINYQLYEMAFGYDSSNISNTTVKNILSAFNVNDPWSQIDRLTSRLNIGGRNLSNSFSNAAIRRHKAAHTATADTPQLDLVDFIKDAVSIAISFDALITLAIDEIKLNGNNATGITADKVKFRYLREVGHHWKEYIETAPQRAIKNYRENYNDALITCKNKIVSKSEFLVSISGNNEVKDWFPHI